jgi:hypothetical protein
MFILETVQAQLVLEVKQILFKACSSASIFGFTALLKPTDAPL